MKLLGLALVLCGCWHFSAPEEPPAEQRAPRRAAVAPADAAVADATEFRAAVADAAVADAAVADAAVTVRAVPRAAVPPAAVPPCLRGRVIGSSLTGSSLILTVAGGRDRGVTNSWTATYLTPAQTPARIVRVERMVTIIAVSGVSPDQIMRSPFVLLCP